MSNYFIGQIQPFGFNFAPRNWAMCNGQILPIAQNTALFSLLGTTYGGNGQTTFALPNLQSRFPLHFGQGPGLSSYALGQEAGTESETLLTSQIPAHNHPVVIHAAAAAKTNTTPANNNLGGAQIYTNAALDSVLDPAAATSGFTGGNQPFPTIPPYLAINWCICLFGIFPSRN